ncbi:Uncharacterised protein [Vibrio cholerae]|nr:Uncharacterised protein [Vibrio cholerae]
MFSIDVRFFSPKERTIRFNNMTSYRAIFDVSRCINVFSIVKPITFNPIDTLYDAIERGVC